MAASKRSKSATWRPCGNCRRNTSCKRPIAARPPLLVTKAAVDGNDLAGDEIGRRRGQERGGAGNVLRRAPAAEEGLPRGPRLPVVAGCFAPGRADPTGSEAIDADVRRQRLSQAAGEGHYRAFDRREHLAAVAGHSLLGLVP